MRMVRLSPCPRDSELQLNSHLSFAARQNLRHRAEANRTRRCCLDLRRVGAIQDIEILNQRLQAGMVAEPEPFGEAGIQIHKRRNHEMVSTNGEVN